MLCRWQIKVIKWKKFPTIQPTIYLPKWTFWIQLSPNYVMTQAWISAMYLSLNGKPSSKTAESQPHSITRPPKIPPFPLTRPTLFLCADPAMFIAFRKNKKFPHLPTLKCFRKLDQKLKKKIRTAKLMLRIIFFTRLHYMYVFRYCWWYLWQSDYVKKSGLFQGLCGHKILQAMLYTKMFVMSCRL